MPKKEGATSTRPTVDFENIEGVASFIGVWDHYVFKKPCQVTGCGHIISGSKNEDWTAGGPEGEYPWITCGTGSGAGVVHDKSEPPTPGRFRTYAICVCCVDRLNKQAEEECNGIDSEG